LQKDDYEEFYNGFANRVLWPILHYRLDLAEFTRRDLGGYFRIPADNRDLNYASYFTEGQVKVSGTEDYNSHNVPRLDADAMADLLQRRLISPEERHQYGQHFTGGARWR
jgi:hypothetical protein